MILLLLNNIAKYNGWSVLNGLPRGLVVRALDFESGVWEPPRLLYMIYTKYKVH